MNDDFVTVPREALRRVRGVFHKVAGVDAPLNGYDWAAYDEIAAALMGYSKPAPRNASEESEAE